MVQSFEDLDELRQEDTWAVIDVFFKEFQLVSQQLESFNTFVHGIASTLASYGEVVLEPTKKFETYKEPNFFKVNFLQTTCTRPVRKTDEGSRTDLTPQEARLQDISYSGVISVECEIWDSVSKKNCVQMVELVQLPIMINSFFCNLHSPTVGPESHRQECEYDQGGYFIVNGTEKVLVAQEKMANNHVFVFRQSKDSSYSWIAEVRSNVENSFRPASATYVRLLRPTKDQDAVLRATLTQGARDDIPIAVVFRALGISSDCDILEHICYDMNDTRMIELVRPSLIEGRAINTSYKALVHIGTTPETMTRRASQAGYAQELLEKEFLPHISRRESGSVQKAYYFGYLVHRVLEAALERRPQDDRDHYGNKRMDLAGALLETLFRTLFVKAVREMQYKYRLDEYYNKVSSPFLLSRYLKGHQITRGMEYALATGNWSSYGGKAKTGVAQVLNRLTFLSTLSHLRRLSTPIGSDSKLSGPRQLHNTHWGMVCPAETPEGHQCGLVKNFALMTIVSMPYGADKPDIEQSLRATNFLESLYTVSPEQIPSMTKIFLNGSWLGVNPDGSTLVSHLKGWRSSQGIVEMSIVHDIEHREIYIETDSGRCCRPIFVVNDNRILLKRHHLTSEFNWDWLVKSKFIEIVDCSEEEGLMIAMSVGDLNRERAAYQAKQQSLLYTHCEIHPSMILGVLASVIPFPDHNQSPRNTYQSAMGKQAIGVFASNFNIRMDSLGHILWYPQKPLARPRTVKYLDFTSLPAGTNVVAVIACYSGYNQEDSVMLNQSSIDRGLFRSSFYRTYVDEEKTLHGLDDYGDIAQVIEKPNANEVSGAKDYDTLEDDGLVAPGLPVAGGAILAGKTMRLSPSQMNQMRGFNREDSSLFMRGNEHGVVDRVMITNGKNGKMVKIRVRSMKTPTIGDKFSSRHGQKGTCGMLYRQEDVPFNRDGITPDLIMNPHAIPSRMTVGHMIECLLSKLAAIEASEGDATPFTDVTVEQISRRLHQHGHQCRGNEVMYHGHTGRKMEAQLFMGPMYYQRLKHLVEDKMFSRARGKLTNLTHQPTEGRSRGGGLRFGEMERDVLIAHGASQFLKDRLLNMSDLYRLHICEKCGLTPIVNLDQKSFVCKTCQRSKISQVLLPYACKLLFQELISMNMVPRIITEPPPPLSKTLLDAID